VKFEDVVFFKLYCCETNMGAHLKNLLSAVGELRPADRGRALLSDFDWQSHGVSHPYIIFMTGRCGSTWLTSLIRKTGLAGNPDEFFNANVARCQASTDGGLPGYLSSLAQRQSMNGRFGLQIDAARLRDIQAAIDWQTVFPSSRVNTFFLYRRNILAQAWSWASAKKTGLWHLQASQETAGPSASEASPDSAELVTQMVRIRKDEQFMEEFFSTQGYEPYYLDYESLRCELDLEMRTILRILSLDYAEAHEPPTENEQTVRRIEYTEKSRVLSDFSALHRQALSILRRRRLKISPEEIGELFCRGKG